jgi:hypothetical protein
MMTLALALAFLQQPSFAKEDVLKLHKAGIGEDVILAKIEQEKAGLSFTADDLAELKKAGVSEKVIARITALAKIAPPPPAPPPGPAPKPAVPSGEARPVAVRNLSHRAVHVSVNAADRVIDFSTKSGTELPSGGSLDLAAAPGLYAIAIEGWPTTESVRIPESGPSSLTVRGADTEYIDVQTIVAEDPDGRRVVILHNEGKRTPGDYPRAGEYDAPPVFYGPDWSYYPYVRDSVLAGVGVSLIYGCNNSWAIGVDLGGFMGCWGWR